MFKENSYYGEIWDHDNEGTKYYCKLDLSGTSPVIETNLSCEILGVKTDLFYGVFNSLGYVTFVNNAIVVSVSGIVEFRKYSPEYILISEDHFIKPFNLKVKNFRIENKVLSDWIRSFHGVNYENGIIEQSEAFIRELTINDQLSIELIKNSTLNINSQTLSLNNYGSVVFNCKKEINFLDSIEIYNTFQKFLFFYFGKISNYDNFRLKCLDCDKWYKIYFKESLSNKDKIGLINLNYDNLNEDLNFSLANWFINDDVKFCSDILIENLLSEKVSNSRRFTNSISAFEACNKRFGILHKKPTLERWLNDNEKHFIKIMNINDKTFKVFSKKIIRTRDFYVHGNKSQIDCFEIFELLYISILIDFIVMIQISEELKLSEKNINKITRRAEAIFFDMQGVNRMLRDNIFLQKNDSNT